MLRIFKRLVRREDGGINIGSIMMLGVGIIFIAVGLIIFPVVMDGMDEVLDSASIDDYTGLESVSGVVPLIVLIGFISAGVITGFFGIRAMKQ